jgi:hypothetical protein
MISGIREMMLRGMVVVEPRRAGGTKPDSGSRCNVGRREVYIWSVAAYRDDENLQGWLCLVLARRSHLPEQWTDHRSLHAVTV